MIIRADGVITWELPNGRLHRPDGPALYDKDMRCEEWYLNGSLHRVDGPAKIRRYINNYEEWYLNGITHRSDGPAVTFSDGQVVYCIHGNYMNLEEFSRIYLITHLCEYTGHPNGAPVFNFTPKNQQ